jgi:undecaprenyl-diphosphatase
MRDVPIIFIGVGFAGLLEVILSTGEVRPQQIAPDFETSQLFALDRGAVHQGYDSSAKTLSNLGLFVVAAYAVFDPVATGFREQSVQAGFVDAVIYAQTAAVTWGVTNLAKIAVRRPRPVAYAEADLHKGDPNYSNSDTDSSLSFFSGHASFCAALTATATYLAFARSHNAVRPLLTLLIGTGITAFVSVERVRSGAHFPTDVVAGVLAGGGIGTLVPQFHRAETEKQRPLWVGFAPDARGSGATLSLSARF